MSEYQKAANQDEPGPDAIEFRAKLSDDGRLAVISVGRVSLEFERPEVVRLAQTLLAMAGVMRS